MKRLRSARKFYKGCKLVPQPMMPSRLLPLLVFPIIALASLVQLSPNSAFADSFPTPRYGGVIEPITTPVIVRYRPFPKIPVTTKQIMKISAKGETQTVTEITYGAYQGKQSNGGVQLTIEIDRIEKISNANKESQKVRGKLSIFVNANGDTQDIKFQIPGLDTSKPNDQRTIKIVESLLEKAFPKLPNEGVVVGDRLYDTNFEQKFGKIKMGLSSGETILGRSHFEGRNVLVTELTGTVQFELPDGRFEFPMRGYSLVDIDTGIHLFSDVTAAGSFSIKGKDAIMEIKQTVAVSLPPKSAQLPMNSASSVQERLKQVKRLLDKGLITTDEAAQKRKEILNSL